MRAFTSALLKAGSLAFQCSAALFQTQPFATTLLRHRFLFDHESRASSINRLRRELGWLRETYHAISIAELITNVGCRNLTRNSLVYTTDDAHPDVFDVAGEFAAAGVPLAMFVPIGWVTTDSISETDAVVEAVTSIQWYEGADVTIDFGTRFSCNLSQSQKAAQIDWIILNQEELRPHLEELCAKISSLEGSHHRRRAQRGVCDWAEIKQLASSGVHVASHSVSHIKLAQASGVRQRYEIEESKRIIESRVGSCPMFAYPFGTPDTFDALTTDRVRAAGYEAAFLTHSDVVTNETGIFHLPRISLPDVPLQFAELKYRVEGAGILIQRARGLLRRGG